MGNYNYNLDGFEVKHDLSFKHTKNIQPQL